jgi:general stress protein 26
MSELKELARRIEKLFHLLHGIPVGMLTSVEDDGTLHSRPMMPVDREFDGYLWFFTHLDSAKVHEVGHDRHVNVGFASPHDGRYISIAGIAKVYTDPRRLREMWRPELAGWFPEGCADPNLGLLRVEVLKAAYWDANTRKMELLVDFDGPQEDRVPKIEGEDTVLVH